MGKLKLINKDLFSTTRPVIAHGVNCRGRFGSGVAYHMTNKFPEVKESYLYKYHKRGWKLGDYQIVKLINPSSVLWVANCATQYDYGYDGKLYADYDAIRKSLGAVLQFAWTDNFGVAIPKIGCGLAGGDWSIVEKIILEHLKVVDVEVDVHYL